MKSITADIAPFQNENRIRSKQADMLCPACRSNINERELECYYEEDAERKIEICTQCREDFESDNDLSFDSDTLDTAVFQLLWDFASSSAEATPSPLEGINEDTAPVIAHALGGEAWQSGGGIWLVLITKKDGRLVVISEDVVCEYANQEAFDNCKADTAITFR